MSIAAALLGDWRLRAWPRQQVAWLVVGLAMLGFCARVSAETREVPLWKRTAAECPENYLSRQARACIPVEVEIDVLKRPNVDLLLELPDGVSVRASRIEAQQASKEAFIWHGTIKGKASSVVTFSVVNNSVVGTIAFDGKMYRLRSPMKGVRIVELLDPKQIPPGGEIARDQSRKLAKSPDDPTCPFDCLNPNPCQTDSPYRIDVMVLYTSAARTAAGGDDDDMAAWIALHVYMTNLSYIQSKAAQQLHLVHSEQVQSYTEVSTSEDLKALTLQCDSNMDEAHSLRNRFNADAVVLITHETGSGTGGLAKTMQEYHVNNTSFEPCAFAVLRVELFLTPELAFAHELGHLMGAQHEGTSLGAIPDSSHGYIDQTPGIDPTTNIACGPWMTIMAQRASCSGCDHIPFWSNVDPSISHCGEGMGNAFANNRDTLNLTALTVANFRCGSPVPNNVWMKDAWEDTGAEPDANLAAAPMWKSPYIWVRNAPDPGLMFEEQHQHQNPVAGQINYIYVKVHNNGAAANGTLQVWVAKASSSLSWQGSFSQVGSVPIPTFTPNSTRIVEVPWNPTQSGHYCLIARWDSAADPMTTAETAQVDANVRGNNNIVWRNVNLVSLGSPSESSATFLIRNVERAQAHISLEVKPSDRYPTGSFLKFGKVSLRLDEQTLASWKQGGFKGRGFERVDQDVLIVDPNGAILENLVLEGNAERPIKITFSLNENHPRGMFLMDVVQSSVEHGATTVVGGLTYEIHTDER
jgi:hypothetical protein